MEPKEREVPVIWRGIGFVMIFITPAMGYAIAKLIVDANKVERWVAIPTDLVAPGKNPDLYVIIGVTVVFSLLVYLVLSLFSFLLLSIFSPSRYGPQDVPPTAYRGKRYKR
jgi:hypothetical protein